MPRQSKDTVAVLGIDIGNVFHLIGLDKRGAIVLRQKLSRGQLEARLANMPPCLIGMEACVGAHHHSPCSDLPTQETSQGLRKGIILGHIFVARSPDTSSIPITRLP